MITSWVEALRGRLNRLYSAMIYRNNRLVSWQRRETNSALAWVTNALLVRRALNVVTIAIANEVARVGIAGSSPLAGNVMELEGKD